MKQRRQNEIIISTSLFYIVMNQLQLDAYLFHSRFNFTNPFLQRSYCNFLDPEIIENGFFPFLYCRDKKISFAGGPTHFQPKSKSTVFAKVRVINLGRTSVVLLRSEFVLLSSLFSLVKNNIRTRSRSKKSQIQLCTSPPPPYNQSIECIRKGCRHHNKQGREKQTRQN